MIPQPWRIKNEISFKDYKYKVNEELYKLNFKKLTIIIFYYLIKFFYFLDTIYIKLTRVKNFFYRNLSNKCILLISSDRKLYNNIIDCNKFLDNIFKKINLDFIKNK